MRTEPPKHSVIAGGRRMSEERRGAGLAASLVTRCVQSWRRGKFGTEGWGVPYIHIYIYYLYTYMYIYIYIPDIF